MTEASASFRVFPGRTKDDRASAYDTDHLQKGRIQARQGGYMERNAVRNPLAQSEDSCAYADALERFSRDAAEQEREARQSRRAQQEHLYKQKRQQGQVREMNLWNFEEKMYDLQQWRTKDLKNAPIAQNNMSGVPYDLITLQYKNDYSGEKLRYQDEMVRYRAAQRSNKSYQINRSTDYNVVNLMPVPTNLELPAKPIPPPKPASPISWVKNRGGARIDVTQDENLYSHL